MAAEISDNLDNKEKLWKTFNKISNRKTSKKSEIKCLFSDCGQEIVDPQKIANTLNNHFNRIGQKMADKILKWR